MMVPVGTQLETLSPAELPAEPVAPPPAAEDQPRQPESPNRLIHATRAQRIGAVVALLVVTWLALQLFASVLLPFVAAAGIAYVLDPPTSRLVRLGMPRGAAALLMLLALIAAALLFALCCIR
jgi:predicted PurR-regulated permease PerM